VEKLLTRAAICVSIIAHTQARNPTPVTSVGNLSLRVLRSLSTNVTTWVKSLMSVRSAARGLSQDISLISIIKHMAYIRCRDYFLMPVINPNKCHLLEISRGRFGE
jgi:hypothetical protein